LHASRSPAAGARAFGGYGFACADRQNAKERADWQAGEVERWVRQRGDPAACRAAVAYWATRATSDFNRTRKRYKVESVIGFVGSRYIELEVLRPDLTTC